MKKIYDLTFVIPVYNAKNNIHGLIKDIYNIGMENFQIILVDDASTDGSKEEAKLLQAKFHDISLIELQENRGAGNARNIGFDNSKSKYTMFFDSDDKIHGEEIYKTIEIMNFDESVDVAMFTYIYDDLNPNSFKGMSYLDQSIIDMALKNQDINKVSIWECPDLVRFSNYPWNKIIRTKTYKQNNLKFSDARSNNDMLAHWKILTSAKKIILNKHPVCTHVVASANSNITNGTSENRLEMFTALKELYDFLESDARMRRLLCVQYWDLALSLSKWYKDKINPSLAIEYNSRLRDLIMGINLEDVLIMKKSGNNILSNEVIGKIIKNS